MNQWHQLTSLERQALRKQVGEWVRQLVASPQTPFHSAGLDHLTPGPDSEVGIVLFVAPGSTIPSAESLPPAPGGLSVAIQEFPAAQRRAGGA